MPQQTMNEPSRDELVPHLIARAAEDDNFRQRLLSNPKEVVEEALGRTLPDYMKIEALQETTSTIYIVLPASLQHELTDEDLESIAGGLGGDNAWRHGT